MRAIVMAAALATTAGGLSAQTAPRPGEIVVIACVFGQAVHLIPLRGTQAGIEVMGGRWTAAEVTPSAGGVAISQGGDFLLAAPRGSQMVLDGEHFEGFCSDATAAARALAAQLRQPAP